MGIGLGPVLGVQVRLSEGGAPFFVEGWMRDEHGGLAVSTEEGWSSLVEALLVGFETKGRGG